MSVECAFRSDHPAVLAVWEEYLAERERAPQAWRAFRDEVAPDFDYLALEYSRRAEMVGIQPRDDGASPGEAWRLANWKHRQVWVPDKRRRAGKELQKALDALPKIEWPQRKLPGMPPEIGVPTGARDGTFSVRSPSVGRIGGHIYAGWPVELERVEKAGTDDDDFWGRHGQRLDRTIWQQIKLSEYYAAQEAAEEADKARAEEGSG